MHKGIQVDNTYTHTHTPHETHHRETACTECTREFCTAKVGVVVKLAGEEKVFSILVFVLFFKSYAYTFYVPATTETEILLNNI